MPTATANPPRKPAPCAVTAAERICIVADDLTGACDAAAAFLPTGRAIRVWLGATPTFPAPEPVQAFHTDSRSMLPARAMRIVRSATASLATMQSTLFFKKIDSAARGPFAVDILAAQRGFGSRAVLVAPAFPALGRTIHGGILEIRDAAGQCSRIDLVSLFPPRLRGRIQLVSRPDELAAAFDTGKLVLLCDASTQSDLDKLVRAAERLPGLLFAGSAGLAQALAGRESHARHRVPSPSAVRTLIFAGSNHPVTKLQLKNLDSTNSGGVKVLHIDHRRRDPARIFKAFHRFSPEALILTGGDTAQFAASTLGAHSLILQGEFAPGIPWGIVQGGLADGRVAITKSGGFGTPTILNEILGALRGDA